MGIQTISPTTKDRLTSDPRIVVFTDPALSGTIEHPVASCSKTPEEWQTIIVKIVPRYINIAEIYAHAGTHFR